MRYFEDINNAEHWNTSLKKPSLHELHADNSILKHKKVNHVKNVLPVRESLKVLNFDRSGFTSGPGITGNTPEAKVKEQLISYPQHDNGPLPGPHVACADFAGSKSSCSDRPDKIKKRRNTKSRTGMFIIFGLVISLISAVITYKYLIASGSSESALSGDMTHDENKVTADAAISDLTGSDNSVGFNEIPLVDTDDAGIPVEHDSEPADIAADTYTFDIEDSQHAPAEDAIPLHDTDAEIVPVTNKGEIHKDKSALSSAALSQATEEQTALLDEENIYPDAVPAATGQDEAADSTGSGPATIYSRETDGDLPGFSPLDVSSVKVKDPAPKLEAGYNTETKAPEIVQAVNGPGAHNPMDVDDVTTVKSAGTDQDLADIDINTPSAQSAALLLKKSNAAEKINDVSNETVSAAYNQSGGAAAYKKAARSSLVPKAVYDGPPSRSIISSSLKEMFVSYEEDFNGNVSDWPLVDNTRFSTFNNNGSYYIEHRSEGMDSVLYSHDIPHGMDFIIHAYVSSFQGTSSNFYGLLFGAQDSANGYLFLIGNDQRYSIRKLSDGNSEELAGGTIDNIFITGSSKKSLKVVKQNSVTRFYINDHYIDEVTEAKFPGEKIGFTVEGKSKISVDWIKTEIRFKSQ